MARKAIYIIVVLIAAAILVWITVENKSAPLIYKDLVKITKPVPNELIFSPLTIEGEARGFWYFEASFPVLLLDANGKEISRTTARAQGEWMTENYVPFKAMLEFTKPATATGTLVLEKDNPSDLPENADGLKIPVRF